MFGTNRSKADKNDEPECWHESPLVVPRVDENKSDEYEDGDEEDGHRKVFETPQPEEGVLYRAKNRSGHGLARLGLSETAVDAVAI